MAKETKAERAARVALECANYHEEQRTTYLPRLMALLERAQEANFKLSVEAGVFVVTDRDDRDANRYVVPTEYESDTWDSGFSTLEREVAWKEERTREENRKFLAKQTALAKLNKEERELLGV